VPGGAVPGGAVTSDTVTSDTVTSDTVTSGPNLPPPGRDRVRFATYNTFNLFLEDAAPGAQRYAMVVEIIEGLGADVLAVQEIRAATQDEAEKRLRQLADDTGFRCVVPRPGGGEDTALAGGGHGFHCGLLWREGIEPVPGSVRRFGARHFWHSLVDVGLEVGGRMIRHASHHAAPFGRQLRAMQNEVLVSVLTNPPGGPPTIVGADWNTESADRFRNPETGGWELYESYDPYAGRDWFDYMVYQCDWDYDASGRRRHWVDRRPGDVLWSGGLFDAAAALRAPWRPTTGHHPDDPYGAHGVSRRIDAVRVTHHLLGALAAYHVADSPLARAASDHLPVAVDYTPSRVAASPASGQPGGAS
jgi:endonuclease/exonuclease/phosphatase family metal-dependent hydrolase